MKRQLLALIDEAIKNIERIMLSGTIPYYSCASARLALVDLKRKAEDLEIQEQED